MTKRYSLSPGLGALFLVYGTLACSLNAQGKHEEGYDDPDPWTGFEDTVRGPGEAAVARFLTALAASDPLVCRLAVQSVGNDWRWNGSRGLLDPDSAGRAEREMLTHRITDPGALARLSQTLGHEKPCLRGAAARMLGNSETREAVTLLREALRSPDPRTREAAALGLAHAEDPASFRDLSDALGDSQPAVLRMAIHALGELEDARAVKPLSRQLRAKDAETRAAAAEALGEIEDIRAVEALTPLVRDPQPSVRVAAIDALGELEDYRAGSALAAALRDDERAVRRAAAAALGEVESRNAVSALVRAIDDPDPVVRRLAIHALGEQEGVKHAPPRLIAALRDPDPIVAGLTAKALGEIGDTTAVPALAQAYGSGYPRVRFAVVEALAEMEDRRVEVTLGLARKDPDRIVRHRASEALEDREDDD
jgi:HEAT repeat protein